MTRGEAFLACEDQTLKFLGGIHQEVRAEGIPLEALLCSLTVTCKWLHQVPIVLIREDGREMGKVTTRTGLPALLTDVRVSWSRADSEGRRTLLSCTAKADLKLGKAPGEKWSGANLSYYATKEIRLHTRGVSVVVTGDRVPVESRKRMPASAEPYFQYVEALPASGLFFFLGESQCTFTSIGP